MLGGIGIAVISLTHEQLNSTPYIFLFIALDLFAIVGLHGYVWEAAYIRRKVWLPFSMAYILSNILLAIGVIRIVEAPPSNAELNFDYINLLIYSPLFFALITYSSKKFKVWNVQAT